MMSEEAAHACPRLPVPPGVPEGRVPAILAYWPAWRVTEWARVEIGSRILVVSSGDLELVRHVVQLCRCRGAVWCAVWCASPPTGDVDYSIPFRTGQGAHDVLTALPSRPDSVIVLDCAGDTLEASLQVCRDAGTVVVATTPDTRVNLNLYPDVHRRELSLCVRSPFENGPVDKEDWCRTARRIDVLIGLGALQ